MAAHDIHDLIKGGYAADAVFSLHRCGVFDCLKSPRLPRAVARDLGLDAEALAAVLDFVYRTTDILIRDARGAFRVDPDSFSDGTLQFALEKFLGAYGPAVRHLGDALRSPARAGRRVDAASLARAFGSVGRQPPPAAIAEVLRFQPEVVVELGCGTAPLLRTMCADLPGLRGVAIDASLAMCREARRQVTAVGLESRVRVVHADVRHLGRRLSKAFRLRVDVLYCQSLLNAFCREHGRPMIELLQTLRKLFPDRALVAVDYYGNLAQQHDGNPTPGTVIQDLAQVASGQGVPPCNAESWFRRYRMAGCQVMRVLEGRGSGFSWFVHVIGL